MQQFRGLLGFSPMGQIIAVNVLKTEYALRIYDKDLAACVSSCGQFA